MLFRAVRKRARSKEVFSPRSGTQAGRNIVENGLPCEGEPALPGPFTPIGPLGKFAREFPE